MRLAIPDVDATRALARAWAEGASPVDAWEAMTFAEAERALRAGHVDLAFIPTLAVLRDPEAFSVVPGIGLVGSAYLPVRLDVRSGLDAIHDIGIDPRYAQEALLAQVVLKELYDTQPRFVPLQPDAETEGLDAVLLVGDAATTANGKAPDGIVLDLIREWFEMTTRPFVGALLVAPFGGVTPDEARRLRDIATDLGPPPDPTGVDPDAGGVTLAGWAHAGLDEWVNQLFYHRALDDLPQIPFIVIPTDDEE